MVAPSTISAPGFGLCFLYLRNVNRFQWNHKRGYRTYREPELYLGSKPRHLQYVRNRYRWQCRLRSAKWLWT